MGETYLITKEQGEAILKYLLKQTYQDVRSLIVILEQLPTVNVITEPANATSDTVQEVEVTQ